MKPEGSLLNCSVGALKSPRNSYMCMQGAYMIVNTINIIKSAFTCLFVCSSVVHTYDFEPLSINLGSLVESSPFQVFGIFSPFKGCRGPAVYIE